MQRMAVKEDESIFLMAQKQDRMQALLLHPLLPQTRSIEGPGVQVPYHRVPQTPHGAREREWPLLVFPGPFFKGQALSQGPLCIIAARSSNPAQRGPLYQIHLCCDISQPALLQMSLFISFCTSSARSLLRTIHTGCLSTYTLFVFSIPRPIRLHDNHGSVVPSTHFSLHVEGAMPPTQFQENRSSFYFSPFFSS